jgi:hypothetical protein
MRLAVLALLTAAAIPAAAQERPQLFPTRDVSVTYRFLGPQAGAGAPEGMTMSWLAASQLMRMDLPGTMWSVADHRNGRAFAVMEQMRMIMDIPLGQAMQQHGPSPNATYRREGTETVAGLQCTNWSYQDRGNTGRACITAEGVMLRGQGTANGQTGGMEATRVTFGAQDPARFQRPQGYQAMQMPQGMPPGMVPGAGGRPPAR